MKPFLLATLFLIACHRQVAPSAGSTTSPMQGKSAKIVDGDTFDLLTSSGQTVRIRLDGIDCPEKNQPFGKDATQRLTELISGKSLRVTGDKKDRDGRLIGTVFAQKVNVNQTLVRDGYAWHFKQYSKDTTLAALEQEARTRRVGLWADAQPIAPWDWRKKKKTVKQ